MNRYAYFRQQEKNYLAHHGILGQKWGIRRFQNPDGSLTEAGKKRYGYNDTNIWSRDRQEKSAQRRKDYINQFNKDNKGHKFGPNDEQALRDQYMLDNGESLGEKLYYQDKTASEVVDAVKSTNNRVSDDIRDIDDDYRKWSELAISEINNKPLKSPHFANEEQVEDLYMKYIDPEGYKIKEEKKQKEIKEQVDNYKKDFIKKQYKYSNGSYYEKEKDGVLYSFTDEDDPESIKTMKYVEQNQNTLKKQWDNEIYNYLKDEMAHWIEDENGNIPSKEEIMKDVKLSTITANGYSPIVNIWYDDGNNGKFLLGGHSVDFDYIVGAEENKYFDKDYRLEG